MFNQYEVYWVNLDPTVGYEIKKTRPCVVISPDEINKNLQTVVVAPLTTKGRHYPSRLAIKFAGKDCLVVLDQVRAIDKTRLHKKAGNLQATDVQQLKLLLQEMLVD